MIPDLNQEHQRRKVREMIYISMVVEEDFELAEKITMEN